MPDPIRKQYQRKGVVGYYAAHGDQYRNPHEAAIHRLLDRCVADWPLDLGHVLDLACGSGEVTLALRAQGAGRVDGVDPYTATAYEQRTGLPAQQLSFEAVSAGALDDHRYTLIVCSFALHLLQPSRLPDLLARLALLSPHLLVLTPHKRPDLTADTSWRLIAETIVDRVRARLYESRLGDFRRSMLR